MPGSVMDAQEQRPDRSRTFRWPLKKEKKKRTLFFIFIFIFFFGALLSRAGMMATTSTTTNQKALHVNVVNVPGPTEAS